MTAGLAAVVARWVGRGAAGLALLLLAAAGAAAQQPPPRTPGQPPMPVADSARASRLDTLPSPPPSDAARSPLARRSAADSARADSLRRARGDTLPADSLRPDALRADSSAADSAAAAALVEWAETDSVMAGLLARQGYTTTRYQGEHVTFLAPTRTIVLVGEPAAVQQGEQVAVGARITYDDSTGRVALRADSGGTVVLRDPSEGEDIIATFIDYDLRTRRGVVDRVSTAVTSGETWYVAADRAGVVGSAADTTAGYRFYGHDGSITSCDLTIPHYHFEARNMKVVKGSLMVARPAVLYIGNVPVMWLPFVFQDMRSGRRSGLLSPRFGIAELVRNSSTYRRSIENLGYYFAISDYADASVWLDWRSGARQTEEDPGYLRYNGELQYNWENRFLTGRLGAGYEVWGNGRRNLTLSWGHQQRFSQRTSFTSNVNYAQSTLLQRVGAIVPAAALATIRSNATFQTQRGPFSLNVGGSQTQYTGQERVDRTFPSLNLSAKPISIGEWLTWTPSLSATNTENLHNPLLGELGIRPRLDPTTGVVTLDTVQFDRRNTSATLSTPLKIFDFDWTNTLTLSDVESSGPVRATTYDPANPADSSVRVYAREFRTEVDWTTSINLPQLFGGTWNLSPSVGIQNVAPGGFLVRSFLSGGEYVRQRKRLTFGLSSSPTLYRRFPGFGPFEALRHSITPIVSYSYAPAARVGDDYLRAIGQNPSTYVGSLASSSVQLTLSTVLEAKLRAPRDSAEAGEQGGAGAGAAADGRKLKLLALNFSTLAYDFIRADTLGRGITTENFNVDVRSDLLPGFSGSLNYSLFNGPSADTTSSFKPFLRGVNASFSIGRRSNVFALLSRVFGGSRPVENPQLDQLGQQRSDSIASELAQRPVAGSRARVPVPQIPTGQGWRATFNFSMQRTRPDLLGTVVDYDPASLCEQYRGQPAFFDRCVEYQQANPPAPGAVPSTGGVIVRTPPVKMLRSNLTFDLTSKWSGTWGTSYDFERNRFGEHLVSLQRDLHDWRAVFSFTQSPNGNFAFTFFIALKAEPDLRFDFDRQSYRAGGVQR
ncbi:MAG TPA: putative LPS assembly protein LptD [Gemmatimonadaceae bacterium]|nr:putative LPS assembly protein LptD [Gemmatimonadaceae bacterium]